MLKMKFCIKTSFPLNKYHKSFNFSTNRCPAKREKPVFVASERLPDRLAPLARAKVPDSNVVKVFIGDYNGRSILLIDWKGSKRSVSHREWLELFFSSEIIHEPDSLGLRTNENVIDSFIQARWSTGFCIVLERYLAVMLLFLVTLYDYY